MITNSFNNSIYELQIPMQLTLDSPMNVETKAKPFLKWAGGKSRLVPEIIKMVPKYTGKYIEPFLGGASVFLALKPMKGLLSDLNPELMECYQVVRDEPYELMNKLGEMPLTKEDFYRIRDQPEKLTTAVERATRLIYLNKTCYNGVYRVNRDGKFNTPFGCHKVRLFEKAKILACSYFLRRVELTVGDFGEILMRFAESGDFVYLDPPYPSVGLYSDFRRYTKDVFSDRDHLRLARVVHELDTRGCKFILSYAKHNHVLELYSMFKIKEVEAPRFVNCKGGKRGNVPELLITNAQA